MSSKRSFVRRSSGQRKSIRAGVNELDSWYNVRRFRVRVSSRAYITSIEYTECIPKESSDEKPITTNTPSTSTLPQPVPTSSTTTTPSGLPVSVEAKYSCEFFNMWSRTRHPIDYPDDAHWSPPVLLTHPASYRIWQTGAFATSGAQLLAEVSSILTLF